jgi:hypothetical protein
MPIFNEEEIKKFINEANYVQQQSDDHDSCGNYWETRVYEKYSKFYLIDFINNYPCEQISHKKDGKLSYLVKEAVEKTRPIIETYYQSIEDEE